MAERKSHSRWVLPLRGAALVMLFLAMALGGGLLMFAITQVVIRSFGPGLPLPALKGAPGQNR